MIDGVRTAHRRADCAVLGAIALAGVSGVSAGEFNRYTYEMSERAALPDSVEVTASPVAFEKIERAAQGRCLAEVLYYEARGEGIAGQKAVAEVVLQRTHDLDYPDTVCGVVYDGVQPDRRDCQFSFACDGELLKAKDRPAWNRVRVLAEKIMTGTVRLSGATGRATAFHNVDVAPDWAQTMTMTAQIGNHVFYRRDPSAQVRLVQLQSPKAQGASGAYLPAPAAASEEIEPQVQTAGAVGDGA